MDIHQKIQEIRKELDVNSINKQRKRYLESYLFELTSYAQKHPEANEIPSQLALYCELNPDASECRIFDV